MNRTTALILSTLFSAACLLISTTGISQVAAETPTKLRRFAYIIGANNGGPERVKLRYAGTDASKVARLLRDLGGVSKSDVLLKTTSTIADIEAGFDELAPRLAAARKTGARVELILYYSGHSDERGLLVGEGRLDYSRLRAKVGAMPADVNIAILDSCASGAFTRTKGGKREPAFLVDESSQVTGYAFISSSSADEVAQESDRISASFFTHYLISGLRGGADSNRDGKVTLNEAYQFAFNETVARTESTVGGAQHPAYNMHLVGTGDVIMTDLRATSASLIIARNVRGRLFIRDSAGNLVIELNKTTPHPTLLGLSPGTYAVTLKDNGKLYRASITLKGNQKSRLARAAFGKRPLENATARGGAPGDSPTEGDGYVREPVRVSFTPSLSIGGGSRVKTRTSFSLNILAGRGDALKGVEIGSLLNIMDDDVEGVQIAGLINAVGGSSRGVRVAGLINYTSGSHHGTMAGGLLNTNLDGGSGILAGGIANYSGADFDGVQIGGIANVTKGHAKGLQVAGIANLAESSEGTQIGLINAVSGKSKGLQIGLVNVAAESDASIGLINAIGNGYRSAEAWTSDTTAVNVGLKLGARFNYTLLALGLDDEKFQVGAGLGFHKPMGRTFLDIDAVAYSLFDHEFNNLDLDLLAKLRLAVGYQINDELGVFAGPTATGALFFDRDDRLLDVTPFGGGREYRDGDLVFRLTPGLFGGVRMKL